MIIIQIFWIYSVGDSLLTRKVRLENGMPILWSWSPCSIPQLYMQCSTQLPPKPQLKHTIYQMLNLNAFSTFEIEKSPLRGNISYQFSQISKDKSLDTIFKTLIGELEDKGEKAERCIVFCQTRKQCSILYRLFTAALGKKNFVGSSSSYDHCLVQMFHAGSPDSVKSHVVKEMTKENSHLRLLICTIAFGMGIDCKDVYRSIHFGPSSTVESLMQETGRLGRDGKQCICHILYNGLLTSHCGEVKN